MGYYRTKKRTCGSICAATSKENAILVVDSNFRSSRKLRGQGKLANIREKSKKIIEKIAFRPLPRLKKTHFFESIYDDIPRAHNDDYSLSLMFFKNLFLDEKQNVL